MARLRRPEGMDAPERIVSGQGCGSEEELREQFLTRGSSDRSIFSSPFLFEEHHTCIRREREHGEHEDRNDGPAIARRKVAASTMGLGPHHHHQQADLCAEAHGEHRSDGRSGRRARADGVLRMGDRRDSGGGPRLLKRP